MVKVKTTVKTKRVTNLSHTAMFEALSVRNETYYEMIDGATRAYIDVDWEMDEKEMCFDETLKDVVDDEIKIIMEKLQPYDYLIFDSSGEKVVKSNRVIDNYGSLRIIFKDMYFENGLDVKDFVQSLDIQHVDYSVYKAAGKQQLLRIPYATKEDDTSCRTFKLVVKNKNNLTRKDISEIDLETFKSFFVTNIDDCTLYLNENKKNEKKKIEKMKIEGIVEVDEKVRGDGFFTREDIIDLVELLYDERQDYDWDKWTKIMWGLKNMSIIYDVDLRSIAHKISEVNKKYDAIYTDKIYDAGTTTRDKIITLGSIRYWVEELKPLEYMMWIDKCLQKNVSRELSHMNCKNLYKGYKHYYWSDFINSIPNLFNSFNDLVLFFKMPNINKCVFRLHKLNCYVVKFNENDSHVFLDKLPEFILTYKDGKMIKTVKLNKIVEEKTLNYINAYDNVTFDPSTLDDKGGNFNMWCGFKSKLLDVSEVDLEKINPILDLIKTVWAANDDYIFRYILMWFHEAFKFPFIKNKVAIILYSQKQQVGKGVLINEFLIPYIYGEEWATSISGLDPLVDNFNKILMNKLFINCDELSTISGSYHRSFDVLKKRTTDPTITINMKFKDVIDNYPDYMNLICSTNNVNCFKIEQYDSRYLALECGNSYRGNFKFFNNLVKNVFNQEAANHFFTYCYYLANFVCVDDINLKDIPKTSLKKEMQRNFMPSSIRFVYEIKDIKGGEDIFEDYDWRKSIFDNSEVAGKLLYECYRKYCGEEGENALSMTKFGRDIVSLVEKRKSNRGAMYRLEGL